MSKEHRPEGQFDNTEAKDGNDNEVPMKRFKALTRRLLNVSNIQLKEEMERDAKEKIKSRRRKGIQRG
jgi:hypothetical protein